MIPLALVSAISIVALVYLLLREREQHAEQLQTILDRLQAPEVVVQQRAAEKAPDVVTGGSEDYGPWTAPPEEV